jgi:UPF0271 protein
LITDPQTAAEQAVKLASNAEVQTLCVHSDTPGAVAIAEAVRRGLKAAGVDVLPLARAGNPTP